jgi:prepilin-type N-terminal cleavage/methylation domain-containing protein
MMSLRRACGHDHGFTLTELLVAMSLSVLVIVAGYTLLDFTSRSANLVGAQAMAEDESRLALEQIGRTLRQAEEIGTNDTNRTAWVTWATRDLAFYSDYDRDEVPELVRYYVSGNRLLQTVAQPTVVPPTASTSFGAAGAPKIIAAALDPSWTGPAFTYYAQSLDTSQPVRATSAASISSVDIRLVDGATMGNVIKYVESTARIRVRSINSTIETLY